MYVDCRGWCFRKHKMNTTEFGLQVFKTDVSSFIRRCVKCTCMLIQPISATSDYLLLLTLLFSVGCGDIAVSLGSRPIGLLELFSTLGSEKR